MESSQFLLNFLPFVHTHDDRYHISLVLVVDVSLPLLVLITVVKI